MESRYSKHLREHPGHSYLNDHPECSTISPLPYPLRAGLISISVFALLSFILASSLFLYLTFKFVAWHIHKNRLVRKMARNIPDPAPIVDFRFQDAVLETQSQSRKNPHDEGVERLNAAKDNPPNQFLVLLFNLIIADMHQAAAFMLSVRWVQAGGHTVGGYYVRAGPWCWVNDAYESMRLLTHYLFIFLSIVITSVLYVAIYQSLKRKNTPAKMNHKPAFLIYPIIYVMCTLPLALGRVAAMAGAHVPTAYHCFAGALIASNGSFDCLLFGTTRHTIVFGSTDSVNGSDTGLETFAFNRTPANRLGNRIWIQGGETCPHRFVVGGWWQQLGSRLVRKGTGISRTRTDSQESLRSSTGADMAGIQMDVVTSVAVEIEGGEESDQMYPGPSISQTPSLLSGEKHIPKTF
ncbi:hypothetical protein F66182_4023 [Fusarium sp. NRRL 66182]|nr:hypothetical protein F66182_4023 [Fusarium sp. NRRL 66182]